MKLAAIDIGTNSIHMAVVTTDGRGSFDVIDREKSMVKLGAGLFGIGCEGHWVASALDRVRLTVGRAV